GLETSRGACANARSFPSRALSPTRACRDSLQRNQTQTLGQSSGSFPNDSTQTSSPAGLGLQHLQTVATPISIPSPCVSFSTEPRHVKSAGKWLSSPALMNKCHLNTELSSHEGTRCQFNGGTGAIELGIDVHQDFYVVVMQEGGANPKPPQRFWKQAFLHWVAKLARS